MRPKQEVGLEQAYGDEGAALIRMWFTPAEVAAMESAARNTRERQTRDLLERALITAYEDMAGAAGIRRGPAVETAPHTRR